MTINNGDQSVMDCNLRQEELKEPNMNKQQEELKNKLDQAETQLSKLLGNTNTYFMVGGCVSDDNDDMEHYAGVRHSDRLRMTADGYGLTMFTGIMKNDAALSRVLELASVLDNPNVDEIPFEQIDAVALPLCNELAKTMAVFIIIVNKNKMFSYLSEGPRNKLSERCVLLSDMMELLVGDNYNE